MTADTSDTLRWDEIYSALMQLPVSWPKLCVIQAIVAASRRGIQDGEIEDRIRPTQPDGKHLLLSQ